MKSAEVLTLRQALEERFPHTQPQVFHTAQSVATGLSALDALLPGCGLPRGRVTLWTRGGGATAVLRAAASAVLERGERSAWIDGRHQVSADGWVGGPLLVRPEGELNALSCAEELLRSGGFALVVLTGVERALVIEGVRLSRAAREGGSSLVVLAPQSPIVHLRLASQIRPDGYQWKLDPFGEPAHVEAVRIRIEASTLGWSGHTELVLRVQMHGQRSAVDPLLRDRRGARRPARSRRQGHRHPAEGETSEARKR